MRRFPIATLAAISLFLSTSIAQERSTNQIARRSDATPKNLTEMVTTIKDCVVRVTARFPNGVSSGTGFIVNTDGIVITAKHVIYPFGPSVAPQDIEIGIRLPTVKGNLKILSSWQIFRSTAIVATDDSHDIALLRTNRPLAPFVFLKTPTRSIEVKPSAGILDVSELRDGESVFTSGYPLDFPILITTSGAIASSDPITTEGLNILDIYWADMQANEGNSGGPLFSRTSGAILGMVEGYRDAPVTFQGSQDQGQGVTKMPDGSLLPRPLVYNSGIALIVPAHYVADLLRSNGIRYEINKRR
jgi:S1-C subfamily serine protease